MKVYHQGHVHTRLMKIYILTNIYEFYNIIWHSYLLSAKKEGEHIMGDIVKKDPIRSLFAWPRWIDEFEETSFQRGLKLREDEKNVYLEAVVAGVDSDDVNVDIDDGVITIRAEKKTEEKKEGEYKSSSYNYYYTCALSGGQWDKAEAEVNNGVLELTIPKTESARPRKVVVKARAKK